MNKLNKELLEEKWWKDKLWKTVQEIHKDKRAINPMMIILIRKIIARVEKQTTDKILKQLKDKGIIYDYE